MSNVRFSIGRCLSALLAILLTSALVGCSGVSSSSSSTSSGTSSPGSKPAIVASFISLTDSGFTNYVAPHVSAVMLRYDWAQLEPAQSQYDWTQVDSDIATAQSLGLKVVVLISLVTDGVSATVPNTSTPAWVLNDASISVETCSFLGTNTIPVMSTPQMMALTQPFILALLQHLDTKAPAVLYARWGNFEGGENCPLCKSNLADGETTALTYNQQMADFVHQNHPTGTQVVANCSACFDQNYANQSGNIFVGDAIGIGQEDLSASDPTNAVTGNCSWCIVFNAHPTAYRYLQPASPQPPTAFPIYFPFAETYNVNAIELPVYPVLAIAYIPNYVAADDIGGGTATQYSTQYQSVLGAN